MHDFNAHPICQIYVVQRGNDQPSKKRRVSSAGNPRVREKALNPAVRSSPRCVCKGHGIPEFEIYE